MRIRGLSYKKPIALAAIVLGLVGGSYGVASAATTSSTTGSSTVATATATNPWGNQRSDETLLTGDTLAQVKAAVTAKVGSDVTIVRIETDADGNAAYEAHLTTSSGTAETVYVDKSFNVVSVETR